MTKDQLREKFAALGVRPDAYSLNGDIEEECYVLLYEAGRWVVFASERGLRHGERWFVDEAEACEFLFAQVMRDPTTRQGQSP